MSLCVTLNSPSSSAKEKVFWVNFFRRKCNVTLWDRELALLCVTELSDGFHKLVWQKKGNQDTSVGFPLLCCDFKPFGFTYICGKYIYLLWQNTFWKSFLWWDLPARGRNNVFIFEMRKSVKLIVHTSFLTPLGSHSCYQLKETARSSCISKVSPLFTAFQRKGSSFLPDLPQCWTFNVFQQGTKCRWMVLVIHNLA